MEIHSTISILEIQPEFVSLAQVKDHLKIDGDFENAYLEGLRDSAIREAEDYLNMFILHRDVVLGVDQAVNSIPLKFGPILDPETFTVQVQPEPGSPFPATDDFRYVQPWGQIPKFLYLGDGFPVLKSDPFAIQVTYRAGLALEDLPGPVFQAIMLMIGDLYEYRIDRKSLNNTRAKDLLRPHRNW